MASSCLLASLDLPSEGPVPEPRPDIAGETTVEKSPTPTVSKDRNNDLSDEDARPGSSGETQPEETYVPPPIDKEDPAIFAACVAELGKLGADFREIPRIEDGNGCGIDRPLEVRSLGNGVVLDPPGTLRCRTAVNLARWTRDVVIPMLAQSQPAEQLSVVNQASTYLCRKRNNASTGKISEHAHGTAVDIAGFTFKSGRTFTIEPRENEPTLNGAFQRSIASAACLYFSTVLDPGSDKAHETHLHLDTLARKGGYRYCW